MSENLPPTQEPKRQYVCVHGHFYQPPRENPSLEAVEVQDSAYPYHDWNERVTAECYAPNAASRIVDGQQRILKMVNNYSQISFNFGPTLLSWLETNAPSVYQAIREADRHSQSTFSGHGTAIAQAYNHLIMPLANRRDKVTQVRWGIQDFQHRFGRFPEGMWLPETAVDRETLEVLAENGIRFTILAPGQARRVRRRAGRHWKDVSGARIDPSRAYLFRAAARRSISIFFYDGPISHAVAFERLLDDGQRFAERLLSGFSDTRSWPELLHIATDGETYGHHHRYGEMALTYALNHIESNKLAELTNYGEYLGRYPADHFVEIVDNTSWSCVHGVERWRSNCGCNSGGHPDWSQEWRTPLREALDWLRDAVEKPFVEKAATLLKNPWGARDDYIQVILDRSRENVDRFLNEHATHPLGEDERITALKLLELQRHALLMYTSCGWFFDELSGLETVQVIHYAGRVVQLAQELFGGPIESEFLERLRKAKSNIPEHGDGARIYEKWVKPAVADMRKVAAHYAISSMFEPYGEKTKIYCYKARREDYNTQTEGRMRMAVGRARFTSEITFDSATLCFAVLHLGDHNVSGGVRVCDHDEDYETLVRALGETFAKSDTPEVIRLLDAGFGKELFSLKSLFRDEQRRIVNLILGETVLEATASYRNIYEHHAPLIRFLNGLGFPLPKAFQAAAEVALNSQLRSAFERPELDPEAIRSLIKEAGHMNVAFDAATLEYAVRKRVEKLAAEMANLPADLGRLHELNRLLEVALSLPFPVNLWQTQNIVYLALARPNGGLHPAQTPGAPEAEAWAREIASLREKLSLADP